MKLVTEIISQAVTNTARTPNNPVVATLEGAAWRQRCAVIFVELAVISWIRMQFMDASFLQTAFQILLGGTLVFVAGILVGSS